MDLVPYLSVIILVSTIATVLLAVVSYAAFKVRDKRKPRGSGEAPVFFHRYRPEAEAEPGAGLVAEGDAPGPAAR